MKKPSNKKKTHEPAPVVDASPGNGVNKKVKKNKNKEPVAAAESDAENNVSIQISTEDDSSSQTKKKRKLSSSENAKTLSVVKKLKNDKVNNGITPSVEIAENDEPKSTETRVSKLTMEEMLVKYPILKDEKLIAKFRAVPISNNQKGRISQRYRDIFRNSSAELDPDAVNSKLAAILEQQQLDEGVLRKVRVLHNMLTTVVKTLVEKGDAPKKPNKKKKKNKKAESKDGGDETEDKAESNAEETEKTVETNPKVKGPKRYVVFVGNLPYDTDKDSIMRHFSNVVAKIKDVRIPKKGESGKKGGIAYLELADESSYQMALSSHHSMLGNRRINVLYTTTGKSQIDKNEAKGKTAKLVALQKSGQLLGSAPLNRKRSARRKKQREAQAKSNSAE